MTRRTPQPKRAHAQHDNNIWPLVYKTLVFLGSITGAYMLSRVFDANPKTADQEVQLVCVHPGLCGATLSKHPDAAVLHTFDSTIIDAASRQQPLAQQCTMIQKFWNKTFGAEQPKYCTPQQILFDANSGPNLHNAHNYYYDAVQILKNALSIGLNLSAILTLDFIAQLTPTGVIPFRTTHAVVRNGPMAGLDDQFAVYLSEDEHRPYRAFQKITLDIQRSHKLPQDKALIAAVGGIINGEIKVSGAVTKLVKKHYSASSTPSERVQDAVESLIREVLQIEQTDPIEAAGKFHMGIAKIHPLDADGNGRLARMFTNIILEKNGLPDVPHVSRDRYYTAVREAISQNNDDIFVQYLKTNIEYQQTKQESCIARINEEDVASWHSPSLANLLKGEENFAQWCDNFMTVLGYVHNCYDNSIGE